MNLPNGNVIIKTFIDDFKTNLLPRYFKYLDYYKAEHPILKRQKEEGKANARLVFQFPKLIVDVSHSYLLGKPLKFVNNIGQDHPENASTEEFAGRLQDIFIENDEQYHTAELFKNTGIMGDSYEYWYADKFGEIKVVEFPAFECIPIYDPSTQELEAIIRVYKMDEILPNGEKKEFFNIEMYDEKFITYYTMQDGAVYLDTSRPENPKAHFMGECPVVHYRNSKIAGEDTGVSDLKDVETLVDEYNERMSDLSNTLQYNGHPFMVFKNAIIDSDQMKEFLEMNAFMLPEGAEVSFLTWEQNINATTEHLDRIRDAIFTFSFTPKFYSDEESSALSGVAIKMKFAGADLKANTKERNFGKGLRKRIRLISKLLELLENKKYNWRNIDIVFTRNLPQNLLELAQTIAQLSGAGVVSKETLMSLLPFITDIEVEMQRLEDENSSSFDITSMNFDEKDEDPNNMEDIKEK